MEYARWSKDALVKRIRALEAEKAARQHEEQTGQKPIDVVPGTDDSAGPLKKRKKKDKMDPSKYTTRMVAFKLAYIGKRYGSYEYAQNATLPSVEEELWRAFVTSCLIFPEKPEEVRWDDPVLQYSKCGRTDRGVSAFGQVIAARVRSARRNPDWKPPPKAPAEEKGEGSEKEPGVSEETQKSREPVFDDYADELDYCKMLNRLLPEDIKILAWCPTTPEDFSARRHCRERQYRYFFTQPAYVPFARSMEHPDLKPRVRDGWLDIDAMREAAKKYEGYHDFRNLCKIDGTKQLTQFGRRIYESDIVEVQDSGAALPFLKDHEYGPNEGMNISNEPHPKVYYFHVRGSAFLWHQIRCMVAILFMVGQGLEEPAVVDRLLDIEKQPRRPNYTLASDGPLVLWDCIFPASEKARTGAHDEQNDEEFAASWHGRHEDDLLDWVWAGDENPADKHSPKGLVEQMWGIWRERKIDEILAGQLLTMVASRGDVTRRLDHRSPRTGSATQRVFEGDNLPYLRGRYTPLSQMALSYTPEEVNDREARRKGYADSNALKEAMMRRGKERAAAAAAMVAEAAVRSAKAPAQAAVPSPHDEMEANIESLES